MDDSWVSSPERQTHLRHLEAFFTTLDTNGLAINLDKCVFATPSLEILSHTISAAGAAPTADHAAKIVLCPPPQDIKQLQHFLGMVNFYRHFLPKCAQVLRPWTDLLKGGAKTLEWMVSAQEAFQNAKRLLKAAVPLQHPAPTAELSLVTPTHIRGVMQQKSGEHWRLGGHLDFSPVSSQIWNPFTLHLTANYWPLRQQLNIFCISEKVVLSNFGPTTNHSLLPYPVFQFPIRLNNNAIWRSFKNLFYFCICQVWNMSLLIFCPAHC
jgi:hypothetical protein